MACRPSARARAARTNRASNSLRAAASERVHPGPRFGRCARAIEPRNLPARGARDHQRRQHVLQLAHVAGPVVARRARPSPPATARRDCPSARSGPCQKCAHERRQVLEALAQRRNRHAHDVEPVAQVAPEPAGRDLLGQRPVRRRDDPRVDAARRAFSPRRRTSSSWSTRSSLAWTRGDSSPTSSRNSVPPSASSKRPGALGDRARERAARVAEELGLDAARRRARRS